MLEKVLGLIPWLVILIVYIGEKFQQWYLSKALNAALSKAQDAVHTQITIPASPATQPALPKSAPTPAIIDSALIAFEKKQEGFQAKAKWDYKQWTNGYGTKALSSTEVIDEATAEKRLITELGNAAASVEAFAPNAPRGVKQALTDLTFNGGAGWEHAGLGEAVKAGNYPKAKEILLEYVHAGGQVLDDLVKRRKAASEWFDNPL